MHELSKGCLVDALLLPRETPSSEESWVEAKMFRPEYLWFNLVSKLISSMFRSLVIVNTHSAASRYEDPEARIEAHFAADQRPALMINSKLNGLCGCMLPMLQLSSSL